MIPGHMRDMEEQLKWCKFETELYLQVERIEEKNQVFPWGKNKIYSATNSPILLRTKRKLFRVESFKISWINTFVVGKFNVDEFSVFADGYASKWRCRFLDDCFTHVGSAKNKNKCSKKRYISALFYDTFGLIYE